MRSRWRSPGPCRRPPAPAARRGTEFHAWVETRYGQQSLIDPDDLPGSADADIASDEALLQLKAAFEGGPYAHRVPVAVEAPFALLVGGRVVNGRIDAVFEADPGSVAAYDVIDWKTGSGEHVDAMQLAIYRLAWARSHGRPGGAGRSRRSSSSAPVRSCARTPTAELARLLAQ